MTIKELQEIFIPATYEKMNISKILHYDIIKENKIVAEGELTSIILTLEKDNRIIEIDIKELSK